MRVRLRFDPPGLFGIDVPLVVRLDGEVVHEGSFLAGFTKELDLEPGTFALEGTVRSIVSRKRSWSFEVPESDDGSVLEVKLDYDRVWGNFRKELDITRLDPSEVEDVAEPVADSPARHRVVATWALLAVLVLVFGAEIVLTIGPSIELSPSILTLTGLGALGPASSVEGVWFRAISCTFLHGSFMHLLLNAVALLMAGVVVESIVGARWFLGLYFVGGLVGSALSLAFNDGSMISVGASGAIMGVFAGGLFIAQTLPVAERGPIQFQLFRVLVPSLLPIVPQIGDAKVDFGAHLGGAIGGAVFGALLYAALRRRGADTDEFVRSPIATALSAAFVLASVVAFGGVTFVAYPAARAEAPALAALVPDRQIVGQQLTPAQVSRWLDDYPDDPRVRLFAAGAALDDENWDAVEEHAARGQELLARYEGIFRDALLAEMKKDLRAFREHAAIRRELLPNRDIPTGSPAEQEAAWRANVSEWLERYPNDPRVRLVAADHALMAGDDERAYEHAKVGLEHAPRLAEAFPDGLGTEVSALTAAAAIALLELGRDEEAAPLVRALCAGEHGEERRAFFAENGVCGSVAPQGR